MMVSKNLFFEIVSGVNERLAPQVWTIGFVFSIDRRSVGCSIMTVRFVEDMSMRVLGPFQVV